MPIAIDPSTRLPIVLDSDADKEHPPTFYVRPLTVRETSHADTLDQRMREELQAGRDAYAPLFESIRVALVGWENLRNLQGELIPYDPAELDAVLVIEEGYELMRKIVRAGTLRREDKKKSESPPSSSTDSCASNAPLESASIAPVA